MALLPLTAKSKKLKNLYTGLDIFTEYGPVTGGLITAIIMNPSVFSWLIYIILGIIMLGVLIWLFSKRTKTIVWGLILVLILALSGTVMIIVISTCFAFAASNDLIFAPLHQKYKKQYENNYQMEQFSKANGLINN